MITEEKILNKDFMMWSLDNDLLRLGGKNLMTLGVIFMLRRRFFWSTLESGFLVILFFTLFLVFLVWGKILFCNTCRALIDEAGKLLDLAARAAYDRFFLSASRDQVVAARAIIQTTNFVKAILSLLCSQKISCSWLPLFRSWSQWWQHHQGDQSDHLDEGADIIS